jgi:hypothetical protein
MVEKKGMNKGVSGRHEGACQAKINDWGRRRNGGGVVLTIRGGPGIRGSVGWMGGSRGEGEAGESCIEIQVMHEV